MNEKLKFQPAKNSPNLVAPSVFSLLQNWNSTIPVEDIWVAEIDPTAANGQDLCQRYGISPETGANCVIVEAIRGEKSTIAACVALVGYQMNFNGVIRKTLGARRVSLASLPMVIAKTKMEYGSITAFGLPSQWPLLLDAQIMQSDRIIIGSGLLKSKLSLPSKALASLSGAIIIEGLATKMSESK